MSFTPHGASAILTASMADGSGKELTPSELQAILEKLDDVLAEAARLREQIELQMKEQRRRQQQKISRPRRPRRKRSS